MSVYTLPPPLAGSRLARELHHRLPDWPCRSVDIDTIDLVDPAGVWLVHVHGDATVDVERTGRYGSVPAAVFRRPDPGALAAYLDVVSHRAEAGRC